MLKRFWDWLISLFKKNRKSEDAEDAEDAEDSKKMDAIFSPLESDLPPIKTNDEYSFNGVIKDKEDSRDYAYTGKDGRMTP